MKGKYLITTDNWFYAPNGCKYKAAWGEALIFEDNVLGIKTNRNSSNWYIQLGEGEGAIIIAGCQIHYAVRCDKKPNDGAAHDWSYGNESELREYQRPSEIYIAER
jgi:hypothetical protein